MLGVVLDSLLLGRQIIELGLMLLLLLLERILQRLPIFVRLRHLLAHLIVQLLDPPSHILLERLLLGIHLPYQIIMLLLLPPELLRLVEYLRLELVDDLLLLVALRLHFALQVGFLLLQFINLLLQFGLFGREFLLQFFSFLSHFLDYFCVLALFLMNLTILLLREGSNRVLVFDSLRSLIILLFAELLP